MLKGIFILACAILLSLSCVSFVNAGEHPEKMIFLTLNYKDNAVTVKDIAVGNGYYTPFEENENFKLDKCSLKVFDEKEIFSTSFYIDNKRFEDVIDPVKGELTGKMNEMNDADFSVIIPFYELKKIEIICPTNKIILDHDINLTKPLVIPTYNSGAEPSADSADKDQSNQRDQIIDPVQAQNENSDSPESSSDNPSDDVSEKKSLFLILVEIIENVFHYIFG